MSNLTLSATQKQVSRILPALKNRYGDKPVGKLVQQFLFDELKKEVEAYEAAVARSNIKIEEF